jgi:hypothetical protein
MGRTGKGELWTVEEHGEDGQGRALNSVGR